MKTRNRRYPRSSGMVGDKSGESGAFLFPDASQISAMVGDHSRQMKTHICTVGDVDDFVRWISLIQESPKLLGSSPAITNNIASLENLGQTSGDYPIYRQIWHGRQKVKSPFVWDFPDMKTRLYCPSARVNLAPWLPSSLFVNRGTGGSGNESN